MAVARQNKLLQAAANHFGFVMSRLFVPGSEQPRLERDRSQWFLADSGGWVTSGRITGSELSWVGATETHKAQSAELKPSSPGDYLGHGVSGNLDKENRCESWVMRYGACPAACSLQQAAAAGPLKRARTSPGITKSAHSP